MFLGLFGSVEAIIDEFGISEEALKDANILFAFYEYEEYSGSAFVLFERNGKLYEVHGSHCSCHGLSEDGINGGETQWDPEETTIEALKITTSDNYVLSGCRAEWNEFFTNLQKVWS